MQKLGLSSVYGFIVLYLLIMAALQSLSAIWNAQAELQSSRNRADRISLGGRSESLSLTLAAGRLKLANSGTTPSSISYLHIIEGITSSDLTIGGTIDPGSYLEISIPSAAKSVAVVTSLGNVFTAGVAGGLGVNQTVIFDVTGLPAYLSNQTAVTVDGVHYDLSNLPRAFSWAAGSPHNYSFATGFNTGPASRVGWSQTRGLSSSKDGSVEAATGEIVGDYSAQYLLSVAGPATQASPPSPSSDGYFDAGTNVVLAVPYGWSIAQDRSRNNLISIGVDGSTPVDIPRSGAGTYFLTVTMTSPHSVALFGVTQYRVLLQPGFSQSGTVPPDTVSYSYQQLQNFTNILANPGFETGDFRGWNYEYDTYVCSEQDQVAYGTAHSGIYSGRLSFIARGCTNSWISPIGISAASATVPSNAVNASSSAWVEVSQVDCGSSPGCSASFNGVTFSSPTGWQFVQRMVVPGSGGPALGGILYGSSYGTLTAFVDDAKLSYVAPVAHSLTATPALGQYQVHGSTVTYTYSISLGNAFPAYYVSGSRQIHATLPGNEAISNLSSASCPSLSAVQYSIAAQTLTIPDSTISACGTSYTLTTTATGSYAVSQSGSETGDDWYDSGTNAYLAADAAPPFSFLGWSQTEMLPFGSTSTPSTTVVVNSYDTVTANIDVNP